MRSSGTILIFTGLLFFNYSCRQHRSSTAVTGLQLLCEQELTRALVHDIVTPPVAGRIYAYSNLAWYEAIRPMKPGAASLAEQMNGFGKIPRPDSGKPCDFTIAALHAFFTVARELVFSKDSIGTAEQKILKELKQDAKPSTFETSIEYGNQVAACILKRAAADNYKKTRGLPRYSAFGEAGKWQQTPPDYADASEPYWGTLEPLLLDSAGIFAPPAPPPFDTSKGSRYRNELDEVYETSKKITPLQDSTAYYWDDNPFVTKHRGHFTFATKKTTPAGHWMGITAIVCRNEKADAVETAKAFAMVAAALHDGFISCWHEKFLHKTVRPITVIREVLEPEWNSLLQTPPFPEYTSGHSVISGAACTVLRGMFAQHKPFTDTTELEYLGMKRNYASVTEAAEEACISRLYGGIHYRAAIEEGKKQGQAIGRFYINKFRKDTSP